MKFTANTTKRKPTRERLRHKAELSVYNDLETNVCDGYERGFSFTPLDGKKPLLKCWQTRRRAPLSKVLEWVHRGCNLGIRTGRASGLIGIDDDGGDVASLNLPQTWTCITGSGKRHYYFRTTVAIKSSVGKIGPKIDIRGDGGQLVFAGSIHPDTGRKYRWAKGRAPWEIPIAELPAAPRR